MLKKLPPVDAGPAFVIGAVNVAEDPATGETADTAPAVRSFGPWVTVTEGQVTDRAPLQSAFAAWMVSVYVPTRSNDMFDGTVTPQRFVELPLMRARTFPAPNS